MDSLLGHLVGIVDARLSPLGLDFDLDLLFGDVLPAADDAPAAAPQEGGTADPTPGAGAGVHPPAAVAALRRFANSPLGFHLDALFGDVSPVADDTPAAAPHEGTAEGTADPTPGVGAGVDPPAAVAALRRFTDSPLGFHFDALFGDVSPVADDAPAAAAQQGPAAAVAAPAPGAPRRPSAPERLSLEALRRLKACAIARHRARLKAIVHAASEPTVKPSPQHPPAPSDLLAAVDSGDLKEVKALQAKHDTRITPSLVDRSSGSVHAWLADCMLAESTADLERTLRSCFTPSGFHNALVTFKAKPQPFSAQILCARGHIVEKLFAQQHLIEVALLLAAGMLTMKDLPYGVYLFHDTARTWERCLEVVPQFSDRILSWANGEPWPGIPTCSWYQRWRRSTQRDAALLTKLYQSGERLEVLHILNGLWGAHNGRQPPRKKVYCDRATRVEGLKAMLCLRRVCRVRGKHHTVDRPLEVVEPFGQAVLMFLGK